LIDLLAFDDVLVLQLLLMHNWLDDEYENLKHLKIVVVVVAVVDMRLLMMMLTT
jgi:hypothetical protein